MAPETCKATQKRTENRRVTGSARRGEHDPPEDVQNPQELVNPSPLKRSQIRRYGSQFYSRKKKKQPRPPPDLHTSDLRTSPLPTNDLLTSDCNTSLPAIDLPTSNSNPGRESQNEPVIRTCTQKRYRGKHERKFEPFLVGEAPGGPLIPDILVSFEAHIAFELYKNPNPHGHIMCIHQRMAQLKKWKPPKSLGPKERCWDLVEASGLSHLHSAMHSKINLPLITAFVERWHPETNSFHLPFGEMTITLHDVWEILRLQIDGEPVVDEDVKTRNVEIQELASDLGLEYSTLKGEMARASIKFETLQNAGTALVSSRPDMVAAAYLLHLLCSTIFINKSRGRAQDKFFRILRHMDKVPKMAWGATTLAYLYRKLGEASGSNCKQMDGCYTLLQVWIYEYFPIFRPTLNHSYRPGQDVRSMRWNPATATKKVATELDGIRGLLDDLKPDEVTWLPYGTLNFDGPHRNSLYHGCLSCLDISELYMPDRVCRQFGRVQGIPRDVIRPLIARRLRDVCKYKVDYPDSRWAWRTQKDDIHRIPIDSMGPPVKAHFDCVKEYFKWFKPRTHIQVTSPDCRSNNDNGTGSSLRPTNADKRIQQTIPILREVMDSDFDIPEKCRDLINLAYHKLTHVAPEDFSVRQTFERGGSSRPTNRTLHSEEDDEEEDDEEEDDDDTYDEEEDDEDEHDEEEDDGEGEEDEEADEEDGEVEESEEESSDINH